MFRVLRWLSSECIRWFLRGETSPRPAPLPLADRASFEHVGSRRPRCECPLLGFGDALVIAPGRGPRKGRVRIPRQAPIANAQDGCHRYAGGRSVLLEELLESRLGVCQRIGLVAPARPPSGSKILTAIRALAIEDALRVRLVARVVRTGIVMGAVETRVQVRAAARALLAKADGLSGSHRELSMTGMAVHTGKRAANRIPLPRPGRTLAL